MARLTWSWSTRTAKPLGELIHPDRTLSEEEILEVVFPLLDGLEQVHKAGFMHRDIKPANIFIRRDGKPVLIDFGAARQAIAGHSQGLTSIVTAGYAPYEQYDSETEQGPWTDIYAIGATLYRCITGERPVEAPRRAGAVMRNNSDPMRPSDGSRTRRIFRPPAERDRQIHGRAGAGPAPVGRGTPGYAARPACGRGRYLRTKP